MGWEGLVDLDEISKNLILAYLLKEIVHSQWRAFSWHFFTQLWTTSYFCCHIRRVTRKSFQYFEPTREKVQWHLLSKNKLSLVLYSILWRRKRETSFLLVYLGTWYLYYICYTTTIPTSSSSCDIEKYWKPYPHTNMFPPHKKAKPICHKIVFQNMILKIRILGLFYAN